MALDGVTDPDLRRTLTEWIQSDHEFPPRPGQLRPRNPLYDQEPEAVVDKALANPDSLEGRIARQAGALRAGERYDDGSVSWYVPSRDHDPDGWRRAIYSVRDMLRTLQDSPNGDRRLAELEGAPSDVVKQLAERMNPRLDPNG